MLKLQNTLTGKKEIFKPIKNGKVGLYTCGPTVYWYAHIGNLRTYLFEDILKRTLEYQEYKVNHTMNITDVGHLTSDADTGEDKLEKGAKREKKTAWEIADFYAKAFKKDLKLLNIKEPNIWVKATDTIDDQINLIKILEKKGFTYKIKDGIYFNTSKLKTYGRFFRKKKIDLRAGARVKMASGKKNLTDFALWKFTPKGTKRQMEWQSPWGVGFPGWHTECVVMGIKNLGIPFDIHCGGIDHISIHHTNEIAQAEAAYKKDLAKFWLHGEFLILKQGKMAKSEGNIITLKDLINPAPKQVRSGTRKKFNPLSYRYLCLNAHYRSKLTFSWNAMKGTENSLNNLYQKTEEIKSQIPNTKFQILKNNSYQKKFLEFISDDLDMPKALALMWQLIKDKKVSPKEKYNLLLDFDKVLGLNLGKIKKTKIPKEIMELAAEREKCRKQKKWEKSDKIRKKIKKKGYIVKDTKSGPKIDLK